MLWVTVKVKVYTDGFRDMAIKEFIATNPGYSITLGMAKHLFSCLKAVLVAVNSLLKAGLERKEIEHTIRNLQLPKEVKDGQGTTTRKANP